MAHTPYCLENTTRTLNLPGGGLAAIPLLGQPVTKIVNLDAGEGITIMVALADAIANDGDGVVVLTSSGGVTWTLPIAFFVSPLRLVLPVAILSIGFTATAHGHAVFVRDGDLPEDKCSFTPGD